jgi:hypothetical protein
LPGELASTPLAASRHVSFFSSSVSRVKGKRTEEVSTLPVLSVMVNMAVVVSIAIEPNVVRIPVDVALGEIVLNGALLA